MEKKITFWSGESNFKSDIIVIIFKDVIEQEPTRSAYSTNIESLINTSP